MKLKKFISNLHLFKKIKKVELIDILQLWVISDLTLFYIILLIKFIRKYG